MQEKENILNEVSQSLLNLSLKLSQGGNIDPNRLLIDLRGWNHPPLGLNEIAEIPKLISDKIMKIDVKLIDTKLLEKLSSIESRLKKLETQSLQYLQNGNAHTVLPSFIITFNWINTLIDPFLEWENIDKNHVPKELNLRLVSLAEEIDQLNIDNDDITSKVNLIEEAAKKSDELPDYLSNLKKIKSSIEKYKNISEGNLEKTKNILDEVANMKDEISQMKEEAKSLIDRCEVAYRTNTSEGLASAFDQKAKSMSNTMWIWVAALFVSLIAGAFIGSNRIDYLINVSEKDLGTGKIVLNTILSFLSIGAPLWFAWLSTKQISEYFKLSEDYAFKATVSKAYEGYRREAIRIDEALEARLFSSILSRIDEPPLRFVNSNNYGSPWHELIKSDEFKKAINSIPEFKDKFVEVTKNAVKKE